MVLNDLRNKAGMSQSGLAKVSGVNIRTIQAYENGSRNLDGASIKTLVDLAIALECDIADLITDKDLKEKIKTL